MPEADADRRCVPLDHICYIRPWLSIPSLLQAQVLVAKILKLNIQLSLSLWSKIADTIEQISDKYICKVI